ncbi:MAG: hypothetical protein KatS3mg129_1018 [Leptospiraceae bacterium]|nr:MAG: hypothetical protein KatS3mg129_1018 [Leptospiraceae bacterium]
MTQEQDEDKQGNKIIICTTESNFDSNTKVTFYGDSRMDFADLPFPYGLAGMFGSGLGGLDVFLGALPEGWNVQNFAVTGMTSSGLYDHLLNCMRAKW